MVSAKHLNDLMLLTDNLSQNSSHKKPFNIYEKPSGIVNQ